ncbi:alpha-hydroxy acid oxidase [Ottowia sp. VDI28]|uniref:alpha-hydroxy acid oxidase n=1 Tax=Ottowia sp. VDI28 TaxID=3133968 RepID=UPI003C2FB3DA
MSFDPRFGYNFHDLREKARVRLPHGLFEFIDRGVEDDAAIRRNHASFERVGLYQRPLVDVSERDQAITLFGRRQASPFCLAPTGAAGLLWYEGEVATARAAGHAGVPYCMSTGSITSMERVAEAAPDTDLWFQLYLFPDKAMSHELVVRAREAGYSTLIVTVDTTVTPNREHNLRNGFTIPLRPNLRNVADVLTHPRWGAGVIGRYLVTTGMPRFHNLPKALQQSMTANMRKTGLMPKNPALTWDDLRTVRDMWEGPLIVKGITHPEDARQALRCGADGVVVSNHGGRTLDNAPAPLDVLPAIAEAVGDRMTVLMDSGIRRGSDAVKALALGADAVMVGRAAMWGTAVGGEAGARHALAMLRDEIDRVLGFVGCSSIGAIKPSCCRVERIPYL